MEIEVVDRVDPDDLLDLYESVGWSAYTSDPDGLARAIEGSTYVVTARHEGTLIGLARVLSDDVSILYLQDILVRPDWQRHGVGKALLLHCLDRYRHVRTKVLMTDDEDRQHAFYRAMGFQLAVEVEALHVFVRTGSNT